MGPGTFTPPRLGAGVASWLRRAACALLALALWVPSAASAQAVRATADTSVAVIDNSSIVKVADMKFGQIAMPNAAGTVVLAPGLAAACTTTGGLIRSGTCAAARFSIAGRKNNRIAMRELNGGAITLTGPAGATMTVTSLSLAVSQMSAGQGKGGWDFGSWNIDAASGIADFWVGGTLNVASGQAPGVYSGYLNVQILLN